MVDGEVCPLSETESKQDMQIIQVFVASVDGTKLTVDVESNASVFKLKTILEGRTGVPADTQRLLHATKQLKDSRKLQDYGVEEGSTVQIVLRLLGGTKP